MKFSVLLICMVSAVAQISNACPSQCTCTEFPITMECRHSPANEINRMPYPPPPGVTQVTLNNNNISSIQQHSLSEAASTLIYLSIKNNRITAIEEGSFQSLENLRLLHLEHNFITALNARMLEGLHRLQYLHLDSNLIEVIHCSTFASTGELLYLSLSQNRLRSLSGCVFQGLGNVTSLDLSNNRLQQISVNTFDNLENLQNLRLNNNLITSLHARWFSNKQFIRVQLSGNPWSCTCNLRYQFQEVIRRNNIVNCYDDNMCVVCYTPPSFRFQVITDIENIYWDSSCMDDNASQSQNNALSMERELDTRHEDRLDIRSAEGTSGDGGLTNTFPEPSEITCTGKTCFIQPGSNVSSVYKSTIPSDVEQLFLSDNLFHRINATDLQMLYNLTQLVLSNNVINQIDDFSFRDNGDLVHVQLDNNRITTINKNTFWGLRSLVLLDLRENLISGVIRNGTFQYLTSIASLDLAYNRITGLDECAFCNLTALAILELGNNLITTIHRNAFKGSTSLSALDISNNRISTLSFESFRSFTSLREFQTANNNWECTCTLYHEFQDYVFTTTLFITCEEPDTLCIQCATPAALFNQSLYEQNEASFTDCEYLTTANSETTSATTIDTTAETTSYNIVSASSTNIKPSTDHTNTSIGFATKTTSQQRATAAQQVHVGSGMSSTSRILLATLIPAGVIIIIIIASLAYTSMTKSVPIKPLSPIGTNGRYATSNTQDFTHSNTSDPAKFELKPVNVFEGNDK